MPWILVAGLVILIIVVVVVLLLRGKATTGPEDAILSNITNPNEYTVDAANMFTDFTDTYSSSETFGDALVRATNAFCWAVKTGDDAVAKQLVVVAMPTFFSKVPNRTFETNYPFGNNWYQWGVTIRNFYNALWLYAPTVTDDLVDRMENANKSLTVGGYPRTGSNAVFLLVARAWFLKYVKQIDVSTDAQVVDGLHENMPKLDTTNTIWPSDNNYKLDGSFVFHTNLRSYGYLRDALNSALLMEKIYPGIVKTQEIAKIYSCVATRTGRITSSIVTRGIANLTATSPNTGLRFIHGVRVIVQSQSGWSWCGWANNSQLGFAETDVGAKFMTQLYTVPFDISLNTSDNEFTDWTLYPGCLYPIDPPENPVTQTVVYVSKTSSIGIANASYGAIADSLNNDKMLPYRVDRAILVTPRGLKILLICDLTADCKHTLYSGKTCDKQDGLLVFDKTVYVSSPQLSEYTIVSRDGYVCAERSLPVGHYDISFNVTYRQPDTKFLVKTGEGGTFIISDTLVSYGRRGTFTFLANDGQLAVNQVYDGTNTQSLPFVYTDTPTTSVGTFSKLSNGTLTGTTASSDTDFLLLGYGTPMKL